MPHSVLDKNIVNTIGICMFSFASFELDPVGSKPVSSNLLGRFESTYVLYLFVYAFNAFVCVLICCYSFLDETLWSCTRFVPDMHMYAFRVRC